MITRTTYENPWHNPRVPHYGPAQYETDAKPVEYGGYLIYNRIPGHVWDVVKDGKCVMQMAGINGAKGYIDKLNKRETSNEDVAT